MRAVLFCHSIISDLNQGSAHFLRGLVTELASRGLDVSVYEPRNAWSMINLIADYGHQPLLAFRRTYPLIHAVRYDPETFDLRRALDAADLVLVHDQADSALVARIGELRARGGGFRAFFHDTHHRTVTDPRGIEELDLSRYDGVLAAGNLIRDLYLKRGWAKRAWTWHQAADPRVFRPLGVPKTHDLVWIGNWGNEERSQELKELLIQPIRALGIRAKVYGLRYPPQIRKELRDAGIDFGGWLPNYEVPRALAAAKVTVVIPRRPYASILGGIPTMGQFEALAAGSPLVCSAWRDTDGLFAPGDDFLVATDGKEMEQHLRVLLEYDPLRICMAARGRETVLAQHTCAHRTDELLGICDELGLSRRRETSKDWGAVA